MEKCASFVSSDPADKRCVLHPGWWLQHHGREPHLLCWANWVADSRVVVRTGRRHQGSLHHAGASSRRRRRVDRGAGEGAVRVVAGAPRLGQWAARRLLTAGITGRNTRHRAVRRQIAPRSARADGALEPKQPVTLPLSKHARYRYPFTARYTGLRPVSQQLVRAGLGKICTQLKFQSQSATFGARTFSVDFQSPQIILLVISNDLEK